MSPEDKEYYEKYEDLFTHPGWKQFLEDIEKMNTLAKTTAYELTDANEFFVRRGNIQSLSFIQTYQAMVESNHIAISETEGLEDATV